MPVAERRIEAVADPDSARVGVRLKALRQLHGMSQRALARRAGVTNGTISLIEQDKNSPSVASLKKILDVFSMSFAEFFALSEPTGNRSFFGREELSPLTEGEISFRQVGADLKGKRLQILHEHYQVGADTGEEMLQHQGEEAGIVIRGEIEITVGSEVRVLGPGDAYHFDSNIPHRFRQIGDQLTEIISACTPPYL
jgi:transcriptional regulator with XRE-family HTH domain